MTLHWGVFSSDAKGYIIFTHLQKGLAQINKPGARLFDDHVLFRAINSADILPAGVCSLPPHIPQTHTHTRIHGIDGTEAWKGKKINFYSFLLSHIFTFSLYIELNEHGSYHFYCTLQPVLTPWKACWFWQTWCGPLFFLCKLGPGLLWKPL